MAEIPPERRAIQKLAAFSGLLPTNAHWTAHLVGCVLPWNRVPLFRMRPSLGSCSGNARFFHNVLFLGGPALDLEEARPASQKMEIWTFTFGNNSAAPLVLLRATTLWTPILSAASRERQKSQRHLRQPCHHIGYEAVRLGGFDNSGFEWRVSTSPEGGWRISHRRGWCTSQWHHGGPIEWLLPTAFWLWPSPRIRNGLAPWVFSVLG